jgi:hypothetical protein
MGSELFGLLGFLKVSRRQRYRGILNGSISSRADWENIGPRVDGEIVGASWNLKENLETSKSIIYHIRGRPWGLILIVTQCMHNRES